ncbi:hypothetical protein B296_00009641 [Ensete ventricosum]|uniref:Uncharacterized protein n=1 Tax=Ensete ventricosum TaxID=4639 RepID=A0A427B455_ENSVE|nr:hypothetical protein B296_00009641 [Ensete ventricosum]
MRRIGCTLGLTSTDTLGEVTVYGESSGAEIWQKGVVDSTSDASVATKLARALMDWVGRLSALSFFLPPRRGASWSMLSTAGKAPVDSRRLESVLS